MTPLFEWVALSLIVLPPAVFFVSLMALAVVRPEGRARWRVIAWTSRLMSLGSVGLIVFTIWALKQVAS